MKKYLVNYIFLIVACICSSEAGAQLYIQTNLGSGFNSSNGVAVDPVGNIYVADRLNNLIKKMNPAGGNIQIVGLYFQEPMGIALDSAGNILVSETETNKIKKMAPTVLICRP